MDITALFLNYVPAGQQHDPSEKLYQASLREARGLSTTRSSRTIRKLDENQILELIGSYLIGTSMAQLARDFRIHQQTVKAHLDRQGVERRKNRRSR